MRLELLAIAVALLPMVAMADDRKHDKKKARRSGAEVYAATCAACHKDGVANAPKVGDHARWAPLIKEGLKELTDDSIKGKGAMPPRGASQGTDAEIRAAVEYLLAQAK